MRLFRRALLALAFLLPVVVPAAPADAHHDCYLRAWDLPDFQGQGYQFNCPTQSGWWGWPDLFHMGFDNKISSLAVHTNGGPQFIVFDWPHYEGGGEWIGPMPGYMGRSDFVIPDLWWHGWNNRISSILVLIP